MAFLTESLIDAARVISSRVVSCHRHPIVGSWRWPLTIERIAESCLCSRFIYTQKERTSRWFLTSRKKFFNAFHPIFFDSRERIIFEFFFFFFFSCFLSWWKGKFFLKVLVTWPNTSVETAYSYSHRVRFYYIFLSCAFKTYAITIICFRFNFSIKRQLIIQRMHSVKRKSPRYKFIKLG